MDGETLNARLKALGYDVDNVPSPAANYVPVVRTGDLVFVSGQVPLRPGGALIKGRLGQDASLEDGIDAARVCGVNILLQMGKYMNEAGVRLSRAVKLGGFVNATPEFCDHPKVINGCSDLMVEILGEAGRHARFALGVANLPFGVMVEIDAIFEVR